jgi:hypothetical protein
MREENNTLKEIVNFILLHHPVNFEHQINFCTKFIHEKDIDYRGEVEHKLYFVIDHEKLKEYKNLLKQKENIENRLEKFNEEEENGL